jgi:hypothetical protein
MGLPGAPLDSGDAQRRARGHRQGDRLTVAVVGQAVNRSLQTFGMAAGLRVR